jgi:hypothetical protein
VTQGAAERDRNFDRLLTFVDAIVAIAITLLVLPLVELAPELGDDGSVADLLRDHSDELWAFALSFYVIAPRAHRRLDVRRAARRCRHRRAAPARSRRDAHGPGSQLLPDPGAAGGGSGTARRRVPAPMMRNRTAA